MKRFLSALWMVACTAYCSYAQAADWPQWRGPGRDGHSADAGLLQQWPGDGPALRWKAEDIGGGYSSPSIAAGRVYLQTTRGNAEFALALDEKSGQPIWEVPIGKVGRNRVIEYPGTRSTPTIAGDAAYCLSSDGELVCLSAATGEAIWRVEYRTELDGKVGNWAYSESVLVDGDTLVCTPGGESATLAKLDARTGQVVWKSAVPGGDVADYASVMIVQGGGPRQYVQFLRGGLVGVSADSGEFLWRYDRTVDRGANILTPVIQSDRVFSAGSRSGGGLIELNATVDGVEANEKYFSSSLGASIGGAVLVDGQLYGATSQVLFCADFESGQILWSDRSVAPASICFADGRLYVRGHAEGEIALVVPNTDGYREVGRFLQADRSEIQAWPHPVVSNGGLYLRDQGVLLCYEVSADDR